MDHRHALSSVGDLAICLQDIWFHPINLRGEIAEDELILINHSSPVSCAFLLNRETWLSWVKISRGREGKRQSHGDGGSAPGTHGLLPSRQGILFQGLLFQGLLFQGLLFQGLLFQGLLLQGLLFQGLLLQGLLFQGLLFHGPGHVAGPLPGGGNHGLRFENDGQPSESDKVKPRSMLALPLGP